MRDKITYDNENSWKMFIRRKQTARKHETLSLLSTQPDLTQLTEPDPTQRNWLTDAEDVVVVQMFAEIVTNLTH